MESLHSPVQTILDAHATHKEPEAAQHLSVEWGPQIARGISGESEWIPGKRSEVHRFVEKKIPIC